MTHFLPLWCEGHMVVVKVIIIIYRTIVFIIIYCQMREVVVVNVCLVALGQIGVGGKLQGKQAMRSSQIGNGRKKRAHLPKRGNM